MDYMEKNMVYDKEEKVIKVSYPLRPEAEVQPNNYRQIRKIQENIEKRIVKEGLQVEYNTEMTRMLEAGAIRELGKGE